MFYIVLSGSCIGWKSLLLIKSQDIKSEEGHKYLL